MCTSLSVCVVLEYLHFPVMIHFPVLVFTPGNSGPLAKNEEVTRTKNTHSREGLQPI